MWLPRISVSTLLPGALDVRVRAAVEPPGAVLPSATPADFVDRLHRGRADVAVFEPTLAIGGSPGGWPPGDIASAELLADDAWWCWTPLVAYVPLTAASARAAIALARHRAMDVVVAGVGDGPAALRERLELARSSLVGHPLFAALEPRLCDAPSPVREGVRALCTGDAAITTVPRLASRCAMSVATLERWCTRLRIAPPHDLVVAARIARAYPLISSGTKSGRAVARACGLASTVALDRQLRARIGRTLAELRADPLDAETFARHLAARLGCADP